MAWRINELRIGQPIERATHGTPKAATGDRPRASRKSEVFLSRSYTILYWHVFHSTAYDKDRQTKFSQTRNKQGLPLGLHIEAGLLLRWLADRPLTAGACIRTEECATP